MAVGIKPVVLTFGIILLYTSSNIYWGIGGNIDPFLEGVKLGVLASIPATGAVLLLVRAISVVGRARRQEEPEIKIREIREIQVISQQRSLERR